MRFGRDLVWCALALIICSVVSPLFVRPTTLNFVNIPELFLQWFGIPVQLFRGVMATVLALFMVRALNAFELEHRQRLQTANEARLQAQETALQAERRVSREMERLNEELQLTTRELSLLLNLSNLLATPMSLRERLRSVLDRIVHSQTSRCRDHLLVAHKTGAGPVGLSGLRGEQLRGRRLGQLCVEKPGTLPTRGWRRLHFRWKAQTEKVPLPSSGKHGQPATQYGE
jgi:hypothetical protein